MTNPQPTLSIAAEKRIPMSSPDITEAERAAVMAVLNTPMLSMGKEITAFEDAFRQVTGLPYAIGVNSGTAGLHLCVRAAGLQAGDITLTTPFSFVASTNALLFERVTPVFVDVDPLTGNIDPRLMVKAVEDLQSGGKAAKRWLPRQGADASSQIKAILSIDVFGQPADADPILETARQHGLVVIEDSCEALGASYKGRPAGTLGDSAVFAFYPNKQITTGEGGMIVTGDKAAAEMMMALRNQGRAPGDTWLQHTYMGYNYRLDELSAALGRVQMTRLDELIARREQVASWYNRELAGIPGVELPFIHANTTRMSWFVYVIRLDAKIERDEVARRLAEHGIPARPYFAPIHLQKYMVDRFGYKPGDYPVTEDLGMRSLALPFSGVMPEEDVAIVAETLRKVVSAS